MIVNLHRRLTIPKILYLILNVLTVSAITPETTFFIGNRSIEIIIGVVLLCFGLSLLFIGFKFFKTLMFLSGFLLFGLLAFLLSRVLIRVDSASKNQLIGIYVGSILAGLVGGLVSLCYIKIGVVLAGGCLGYFVGQTIAGTQIVKHLAGQITLIIFFVVFLAILAYIFSSIILISATAGIGSFMFMGSVDLLSNSGFIKALVFYSQNTYSLRTHPKIWSIVASGFVLFLLGLLTQFIVKGYIEIPFFSKHSDSFSETDFPLTEQTKSTTNLDHEANVAYGTQKSLITVPEATIVNLRDIILETPCLTENSSPTS